MTFPLVTAPKDTFARYKKDYFLNMVYLVCLQVQRTDQLPKMKDVSEIFRQNI